MEMLVELDRLIQLIESPIFTCEYFKFNQTSLVLFYEMQSSISMG
jgi:hypothetical protein